MVYRVWSIDKTLKLDLDDSNNLDIFKRLNPCLKPVYSIWGFALSFSDCDFSAAVKTYMYANSQTLFEENMESGI